MYKLSSTSALVLLWAKNECYKSKNAKAYLDLLDLESGNKLYEECNKIWQFYNEVIKNRKFGVIELIKKALSESKDIKQIIIAGAGLDALGIEIIEYFPNLKVFELDLENMETKSHLFSKINSHSKSISFITVNLSNNKEVERELLKNEWNPKKQTLLIMEGISYYLTSETIKELIETIKPKRIVFEFLKQKEDITSERSIIADEVFGLISNQCDCPKIIRYDYPQIERSFHRPILIKQSMKHLEKERVGINKHFPTKNSGWIDVCLLGEK